VEDICYDVLKLKKNEKVFARKRNNGSRDNKTLALELGPIKEMMLELDRQLDKIMELDTCQEGLLYEI
jgi:hypothetical protein